MITKNIKIPILSIHFSFLLHAVSTKVCSPSQFHKLLHLARLASVFMIDFFFMTLTSGSCFPFCQWLPWSAVILVSKWPPFLYNDSVFLPLWMAYWKCLMSFHHSYIWQKKTLDCGAMSIFLDTWTVFDFPTLGLRSKVNTHAQMHF